MRFRSWLKKIYFSLLAPVFLFALGLTAGSLYEISIFLVAGACVLFVVVCLISRRFINDLVASFTQPALSGRKPEERLEGQVRELRRHLYQLEQSSQELKESRALFRHAAFHDALTTLPNRNHLVDTLGQLIEQKFRQPMLSYAVLMINLKGFRKINDSLSHDVGDQLLKQVASRLLKIAPKDSVVGRFGADKFGVILTHDATEEVTLQFVESVSEAIGHPFLLDNRQVFASANMGIAFANLRYEEPEEILRDADTAMYLAKDSGKPFVVFEERMHDRAGSLLQLETDLRYAVARGEFEVYYQPIVDLETLRLSGFEALVRWNHPTLGTISPDRFIPLCETTGLIIPMTLDILEAACRQTVEWQERLGNVAPRFVSVNISGSHFGDPSLLAQIESVLKSTGLQPQGLKLEITETTIMQNGENAVEMLHRIRALGVQLSIDDFGTGYSSLGYLQRFPIDTLKIDRAFIKPMEDGQQNGEIVRAVLALADTLNLEVIAEGIESVHQYHQLRVLSCRYGQGYLFSMPVTATDADVLLADPARWQRLLAGGDIIVPSAEYEQSQYQIH